MKDNQGHADIVSIEGDFRYKLGIIDFLTKYTGLKFLENKVKATVARVDSIQVSVIH